MMIRKVVDNYHTAVSSMALTTMAMLSNDSHFPRHLAAPESCVILTSKESESLSFSVVFPRRATTCSSSIRKTLSSSPSFVSRLHLDKHQQSHTTRSHRRHRFSMKIESSMLCVQMMHTTFMCEFPVF